jgi:hypothetical protein
MFPLKFQERSQVAVIVNDDGKTKDRFRGNENLLDCRRGGHSWIYSNLHILMSALRWIIIRSHEYNNLSHVRYRLTCFL